MAGKPEIFDIAILGGTPAGYAAGLALARDKRRVVVVERPARATQCPLDEWVPGDFFDIRPLPRSLRKSCGAESFTKIFYHGADFQRHTEHRSRGRCGYFVNSEDLTAAIRRSAERAGAEVRRLRKRPQVVLREDHVQLLSSARVRARLLIVADGTPQEILSDLAMPTQPVAGNYYNAIGLNITMNRACSSADARGVLHVVAPSDSGRFAMFFRVKKRFHLRMVSGESSGEPDIDELSNMLRSLQAAGRAPKNLPLEKAQAARWQIPAGAAMAMDTHVAKRCLLAGTAGGFADTISGATILPTVRSALLAADVATGALEANNTQEELMEFKRLWRREMAEYLSPPSASLKMLFGMLFANSRIVSRFTDAFVYGKTI